MFKNFINTLNPNNTNNNNNLPPQRHIIEDDDEDDYVEVSNSVDEVDEGWEEVMVVKSPTLHSTPITPITPTQDVLEVAPTQTVIVNNRPIEIVQEVIAVGPTVPFVEAVVPIQDPEWLAALKNNKIPYTTSQQGVTYVAAYTAAEPYAHSSIGHPTYAAPQEGRQYLASINAPVSYMTTTTVISKDDQDQANTPYCVAYLL